MNRRSRRALALTTVGILLVAGTIAGGVWLGQRGDRQPVVTAPTVPPPTTPQPIGPEPTTQPTSPAVAGTWQRLPAAPIPAGGYEFAGVWTGRELLLHGAVHDRGGPHAAGAAYNPATGTWRKLPPAPGPVEVMEGGYRAVWTGTELLGSGLGLNVAYNPATNSWRRLSGTFGGSVWTGRQVLGWGGGCCGAVEAEGTAYTPATDTSQRLPRGPLAARETTMAWTGKELVIVGGTNLEGTTYADAAAYNPSTRTWRRLPPMPEPRAGATATWTRHGGPGRRRVRAVQQRAALCAPAHRRGGLQPSHQPLAAPARHGGQRPHRAHRHLDRPAAAGVGGGPSAETPGRRHGTASPTTRAATAGRRCPSRCCAVAPAMSRSGPAPSCSSGAATP